jgi:hypothetical protein
MAFTKPKNFNKYPIKKHKRVPRKFKKKWKHILQGDRYDFLDLGQKLWFIRWQTNPKYNEFLIKEITKNET